MSEQGYNPNQEPGNNLNLSAAGWNKVTSAVDEMSNGVPRGIRLTPQQKTTRETGRLVTEAEATEDIDVGDWLNIVGVNIDSDANENYFKYGGCLPKVEKLDGSSSKRTLAVAMQPIKGGKYGRICVTGCCVAKVNFPDSALYKHYDDSDTSPDGVVKPTNTDTGRNILWHDQAPGESLAFVALNLGGGGGGGDPQEYLIGTIKTTVVPTASGFTSVTVTVTESTDQSIAGTDVTVEMLGEYPLAAGLYVTATKVKSYASGGTATERWLPLDYEVIEVTPPTP